MTNQEPVKIEQPIKNFKVVDQDKEREEKVKKEAENIVMMSEKIKRPEKLVGATYKIKSPTEEHAIYITINDVVLNEGTDHEMRRPFEVFINSKNMNNFQWVVGLTRVISAVFRKGGDMEFLVEELRSVFDPNGGFFHKGQFIPSTIAQIGMKIEEHLMSIGLIEPEELSDSAKQMLEQKRAEYMEKHTNEASDKKEEEQQTSQSIPGAQTCPKCQELSMIMMDGCQTCLSCGASKCS